MSCPGVTVRRSVFTGGSSSSILHHVHAPDTITLEHFRNQKSNTTNTSKVESDIGCVPLEEFLSSGSSQKVRSGHKRPRDVPHGHDKVKRRRSLSETVRSVITERRDVMLSFDSMRNILQNEKSPLKSHNVELRETSPPKSSSAVSTRSLSPGKDRKKDSVQSREVSDSENKSAMKNQSSTSTLDIQIPVVQLEDVSEKNKKHCAEGSLDLDQYTQKEIQSNSQSAAICSQIIRLNHVPKLRESSGSETENQKHDSVMKHWNCHRRLTKHGNLKLISETATYEEIVSNEEADEVFHSRKPMLPQSSLDESGHVSGYSTAGEGATSFRLPNEAVTSKVLQRVGCELGRDWRSFAIEELDLEDRILQKYEEEYQRNLELQAFKALKFWRDHNGRDATWEVLKQKLINYGKRIIADGIDDMCGKNYETT